VAGNARKEIEKETGKPVITSQNAKQLNGIVTKLLTNSEDESSD
jgi:maleate cis-trans isomerase